jgi:HSP20 family protein
MTLVRCNPNRMMTEFGRDFDTVIDSFFGFPSVRSSNRWAFVPRVDIMDEKDYMSVVAELPGMNKEDVKVLVEDGVLTISGERKTETEKNEANYLRSELSYGSFSRSFTLPDHLDTDKIAADYRNGILTVTIPKLEKAKPKEVKVEVK